MSTGITVPPGIEAEPLSKWLVAHVEEVTAPFTFELIPGGNSNLTYRVRDATGRSLALRRPPLGHILESAHDMTREHRVISALHGTPVPVPAPLGVCVDPDVNGADFYVMAYVEGVVPHDAEASEAIPPSERKELSSHVIGILAELHSLDPDEVGLGDLGRREDYVARQLRRWSQQWEQSKQREIPEMDELAALLRARIPAQARTSIVHGDYRLGNMITADGEVKAVLDWELCTLGDPMADLGYLLNNWLSPDEPVIWRSSATQAGGFLERDSMIRRYAELTGADVGHVDYYQAFQGWRLAAILEGVYARYLHGAMASTEGIDLEDMADAVVRLAHAALERLA